MEGFRRKEESEESSVNKDIGSAVGNEERVERANLGVLAQVKP